MIKLAFSTLGCPGWDFDDIVSTAKDLGYDAVELRGVGRELYAPQVTQFLPENIAATKRRLEDLKLEICCLTSGVRLNETYRLESHMRDAKAYIDLAARLGVPYVRVIGDSGPTPTDIPFEQVSESLGELSAYADGTGVTILIETNGALAKSETMLSLLAGENKKNVCVLWDINHPVRNYGEAAAFTFGKLGKYIKYLHIKDSVATEKGVEYRMPGSGDLPIKEAVDIFKGSGFDGYLSLEWLKRWCLSLAEPGIVFPYYINYMKDLLK